jgi:hypothetical protein
MSKTKPYLLTFTPGSKTPVGQLRPFTGREDFDSEDAALAYAEDLLISEQGYGFFLYKDGELLKEGSDLESDLVRRNFRRRKWQADDQIRWIPVQVKR